jgi:hypothetical protein
MLIPAKMVYPDDEDKRDGAARVGAGHNERLYRQLLVAASAANLKQTLSLKL